MAETEEKSIKFTDEIEGMISAFSEGLQERAHKKSSGGVIYVTDAYALIDEALRAGAEAVIQGQLAAKINEPVKLHGSGSAPVND